MLETIGSIVLLIVGSVFIVSLVLGLIGILVLLRVVKFVNEAEAEDAPKAVRGRKENGK